MTKCIDITFREKLVNIVQSLDEMCVENQTDESVGIDGNDDEE